jgi:hypothetical protein
MDFRIADTFTDSLSRLNGDEQKAVKTTAFDLQRNPANPGMSFHKLDKARDKNFWSVRVSFRHPADRASAAGQLAALLRRSPRRSLRLGSAAQAGSASTNAARRRSWKCASGWEEIVIPRYVEEVRPAPSIFAATQPETLLRYGVPPSAVDEVRRAPKTGCLIWPTTCLRKRRRRCCNSLRASHRPAEGRGRNRRPLRASRRTAPFSHGAQRRRPVLRWTIRGRGGRSFCTRCSARRVERAYNGPRALSPVRLARARPSSPCIWRLYLALHAADARALPTTFSDTLANVLRQKLRILLNGEPRLAERIEVQSLDAIARRLYELNFGGHGCDYGGRAADCACGGTGSRAALPAPLCAGGVGKRGRCVASAGVGHLSHSHVPRRRTRLSDKQRAALWVVFADTWAALQAQGLVTPAGPFSRLAAHFAATGRSPFDAVVVDEAQDCERGAVALLAALSNGEANSLFFTGDLGQRIQAALFLEGVGRRCAWPLTHPARQLPHVAPDQGTS